MTVKRKPARKKKPSPATVRKHQRQSAAQMLGRLGGLRRKRNLSPERRQQIARDAGIASAKRRWGTEDTAATPPPEPDPEEKTTTR